MNGNDHSEKLGPDDENLRHTQSVPCVQRNMPICSVPSCTREAKARKLCSHHYHKEHQRLSAPCSVVGCLKPSKSRGLCSAHYSALKRATPIDPATAKCSYASCNDFSVASGLCRVHYAEHRVRNNPLCKIEGCSARQYSRQMCRAHYDAQRHRAAKSIKRNNCKVEACQRTVRSKTATLCPMHATRLRKFGSVGPAEALSGREGCDVLGCSGEHKAKRYCDLHYRRFLKTGDPLKVKRTASWRGVVCKIDTCTDEVESVGLCSRHYQRLRIYGDPLGGGSYRIRDHSATCTIDGCNREYAALGYCSLHLKRFKAHGDPLKTIVRRKGECSILGCTKPHLARGFCQIHYDRWMKHGDPMFEVHRPSVCLIDGCGRKVAGNGFCQLHYTRVRRWGDPHYVQRVSDYKGALCSIEGCSKKCKSRGWCDLHYDRFQTHGDPMFSMWEIDMDVPTTLYRLFSAEGELLYIGISVRVEQRMYEHSQSKWWWPEVEHQLLTRCTTRRDALELEEIAIRTENPKYNVTHKKISTKGNDSDRRPTKLT